MVMFLVGDKMAMNAWIIMHGYVLVGNKMVVITLVIFLWATG